MVEVSSESNDMALVLDVCTVCRFVWFDVGEYARLPVTLQPGAATPADQANQLPPEALKQFAIAQMQALKERNRELGFDEYTPAAWWHWIPGLLGMPVEQDAPSVRSFPVVTWILAGCILLISLVSFVNLRHFVELFGLVPAQFGRYGGLTLLTSFFLHGGLFHLVSNLYFLLVFGDNVEDSMGITRYLLLIACSACAGGVAHILADPSSTVPCIGASGGISGIITYYALQFPQVKLCILTCFYYRIRWFRFPAYSMFLVWLAVQFFGMRAQLSGFSNVSALAHLGGATTGLLFWLAGREKRSQATTPE